MDKIEKVDAVTVKVVSEVVQITKLADIKKQKESLVNALLSLDTTYGTRRRTLVDQIARVDDIIKEAEKLDVK